MLRTTLLSRCVAAPSHALAALSLRRFYGVKVSAQMVKELREVTGAPIMDCKRALSDANGDMELAREELRKKGIASAQKKAGRRAAEGVVSLLRSDDLQTAVVLELNSETDFVAKNDKFIKLSQMLSSEGLKLAQAQRLSGDFTSSFSDLKIVSDESGKELSVPDFVIERSAVLRENIQFTRISALAVPEGKAGIVSSYVHNKYNDSTGKIGTLLCLSTDAPVKDAAALDQLGQNLAMQLTAVGSEFLTKDAIPAEREEYEKGILREQIRQNPKESNKPANIIERMIDARYNKQIVAESVLEESSYILDGDLTVKDVLKKASKDLGVKVSLESFVKYVLAETQEDDASEEN